MNKFLQKILAIFILWTFVTMPVFVFAQSVINLNAQNLLPKAEIFVTPRNSTFLVGSTFEAPIFIDTRGKSINAINLKINFDPKKLSIVNPSGGKSIFGIWVEPPQYDNKRGTASLVGVVPEGIVTSSGLIITMTFKAISSGETRVSIADDSSVNLNDGLGSEILLIKSGAKYVLQNRAPNGVTIYSDTHAAQDIWYNNDSPIFSWDRTVDMSGFSVLFDNIAGTIPPNVVTHKDASASYENVKDGIWYIHVKSIAKGVWGTTSHFQIRVDTNPPADFKIEANSFKDSNGDKKYMASFFTTDILSGVNHYEVGSINKNDLESSSPVFVETMSPYIVPMEAKSSMRVIVRAHDNAGNVRESYIDLYPSYSFVQILKKFGVGLLILLVILLILELILHYLFGHRILEHIRHAYKTFKTVSKEEIKSELQIPIENNKNMDVIQAEMEVPRPEIFQDIVKYSSDDTPNSPTE